MSYLVNPYRYADSCEDYSVTTTDNQQDMDGVIRNYSLKMLSGFSMIGCKIATAKFYVNYYTGYPQPTGTMNATLYNSSGAVRDTSSAINMSELTTSFAWKEFVFSSPSTVDADDFISFTAVYDNPPNTTNGWMQIARMNSGAPSEVELWLGGISSPDDVTQENVGREPTLELLV